MAVALKSSGAEQVDASTDLRAYVMRAAMHALRRSRSNLGRLGSTEVTQLAEDCAQDALLAILQHRGESGPRPCPSADRRGQHLLRARSVPVRFSTATAARDK
jgi:DNA-directed RNA polymerase specialized sigma24 family protein